MMYPKDTVILIIPKKQQGCKKRIDSTRRGQRARRKSGGTPVKMAGTPGKLEESLSEELVRVGVLPENFDFEGHCELVPMQLGDVSVTYADASGLERNHGFKLTIEHGAKGVASVV